MTIESLSPNSYVDAKHNPAEQPETRELNSAQLSSDSVAYKVDWSSSKAIIYLQKQGRPNSEVLKTKTWRSESFTSNSKDHPSSFKVEHYGYKKPYILRDGNNNALAEIAVRGHTITLTQPENKGVYTFQINPTH